MSIKFASDADEDLFQLYVYGRKEHGIARAEAYVEALWQMLSIIAEQPNLARLRTEFLPPVRVHHWRNHYIVYMPEGPDLLILRILHHTSDLTRHLTMADE